MNKFKLFSVAFLALGGSVFAQDIEAAKKQLMLNNMKKQSQF